MQVISEPSTRGRERKRERERDRKRDRERERICTNKSEREGL